MLVFCINNLEERCWHRDGNATNICIGVECSDAKRRPVLACSGPAIRGFLGKFLLLINALDFDPVFGIMARKNKLLVGSRWNDMRDSEK